MTTTMPHLPPHAQPVALDKAYRLMNHGPTVLVSASHGGVANAMAAAWACVLDFTPPWADERVFSQGRWHFEQATDDLRTLHHVAGGHYLVSGEGVQG